MHINQVLILIAHCASSWAFKWKA